MPLGTQTALLPGWGSVTPFVIRSGSQFRPDAPPALDSERYTRDYQEILEIGSIGTTLCTTLQTSIAHFWRASPTELWNQPLRQAVVASALDISAAARAMALMYLSAADSSIACWDAKYTDNFWRPQPAVRAGDLDGNPATLEDPGWTPLIATPAHPEYPSGHARNSSAMASALALLFGDDPGLLLVTTSTTAPPASRAPGPGSARAWPR